MLLVEDNIETLRVLGRLLGWLGCTVMAAPGSGAEAIETAGRDRIDLDRQRYRAAGLHRMGCDEAIAERPRGHDQRDRDQRVSNTMNQWLQ